MLACQKPHFSLPEDLHYLNGAYMAPLARSVEAAATAWLHRIRAPSSIGARDFFEEGDLVRERFARLIGGAATRVALVPAASYALATVAKNVPLGRGQNVVVAGAQFPSNVYPWRRRTAEAGAELRTVAPPESFPRGAAWNERLLHAIDRDTALVSLAPLHWTDGTRFDLRAIGRRAREVGAVFVVDGTQAVGAQPFDVEKIRPDVLICAGYKWLLGPYGLGVAYYGERFDEGVPLEETWISRRGSENFGGLVHYVDDYQPGALRYDAGGRSNFIHVPMLRAALDLVLGWTPEAVQRYTADLLAPLLDEALALGFRVEADDYRSDHLVGLYLPDGLDPKRLAEALARRHVAVSERGAAIRISAYLYNDAADVAALADALREAVSAAPAAAR